MPFSRREQDPQQVLSSQVRRAFAYHDPPTAATSAADPGSDSAAPSNASASRRDRREVDRRQSLDNPDFLHADGHDPPEEVDLPAADLGDTWPVRALYNELLSIPDVGETTACKLLARKRPHLVPILDTVVTQELSIVHGQFWLPLHDWLAADDRAHHLHLESLRSRAGLGPDISVLRVFDVLTWMTGKGYAND